MNLNRGIGTLTLRLLLGVVFFMQGYGKVFQFGLDAVYGNFFLGSYGEILPHFLLKVTAYYTSYAELICGVLLILGLFKNYAYYILASVLVIVSFGHGLAEPIWDMTNVIFRTALLVPLLLIPNDWDKFNIDYFLFKK